MILLENLLLARIDDRLIHGQVMTAWMKIMPAKKIIIVDNKVANDDFMISVLELAAPQGVKVEVLNEEKEKVISIIKDVMENVFELNVPLKIDIEYGENWYEAK